MLDSRIRKVIMLVSILPSLVKPQSKVGNTHFSMRKGPSRYFVLDNFFCLPERG